MNEVLKRGMNTIIYTLMLLSIFSRDFSWFNGILSIGLTIQVIRNWNKFDDACDKL